ncbi:hypothetical protein LguiB_029706 [Lonicera macranthoides]
MEQPVKGTVTPLSSIFPSEEAQKASKRVQDTITERHKELDQLQEFFTDNTNLINLVQKLPDELHHEIMAIFKMAAFFPGRLIHTNEFLVLLGEGYYADRTSKQTTEILKRRGKALESQIESLKAIMQDLKAKASFFDATAAESAEGLVEIREDYIEERKQKSDSLSFTRAHNNETADGDDEYARMMSRIDELEKEELEAEDDIDEQKEGDLGQHTSQLDLDHEVTTSEAHVLRSVLKQSKDKLSTTKKVSFQDDFAEQLNISNNMIAPKMQFEGSKVHPTSKAGSSRGNNPAFSESSFAEKNAGLHDSKNVVQAAPSAYNEAFTGSIVEHTHGIESNPKEQKAGPPSKPVSRFKSQRR